MLCFYLEAFTVEFIGSKNWRRLSTKLSSIGSPGGDDGEGPMFDTYKELYNLP